MEPRIKRARLHSPEAGQEQAQNAPAALDLFGLLDQYPIRQRLMNFLGTDGVLRLCQTAKRLRGNIMSNEWNINKKLECFFQDPIAFRTELGRCDALICGEFCLQFFDHTSQVGDSLDIVVEDDAKLEQLSEHIAKRQDYDLDESHGRTWLHWSASAIVPLKRNDTNKRIALIASNTIPIHTIFKTMPTTAGMNIISWNKAYAVFPWLTFLAREVYPLHPVSRRAFLLHIRSGRRLRMPQQENQRHYSLTTHARPKDLAIGLALHAGRSIRDRHSWMMTLDTTGVSLPTTPDSVLEYSYFSMERGSGNRGAQTNDAMETFLQVARYRVVASVLRSPSLRYAYASPCERNRNLHFWSYVEKSIEWHTFGQIAVLLPELARSLDRSEPSSPEPALPDEDFDRPEDWEYLDDQFPDLVEEARRQHLEC